MRRICLFTFLVLCGCSNERQAPTPEPPTTVSKSVAAQPPVAQQPANPRAILKAVVDQAIKRIPMAIPNGFDVFGRKPPLQYIPSENGGGQYWEQRTDTGKDEGGSRLQVTNYSYNTNEHIATINLESYNFVGTTESFRKYNVSLLFDANRFVIDKVTWQSKNKSSDAWSDEVLCDADKRGAIGQLFPGL